jgi:hypothetical protein
MLYNLEYLIQTVELIAKNNRRLRELKSFSQKEV